jgi:hypothetical protein
VQNVTYYKRGRCKAGEDLAYGMSLGATTIEYWEEGCTFASVTPRVSSTAWFDDHSKLRREAYTTYEIKAKCTGMEERWSTTIWLRDKDVKFCQEAPGKDGLSSYWKLGETEFLKAADCDSKVILSFEKDRYTITRNDEMRGFCRFSSINSVWDPGLGVTTKGWGGPVTYITSQCPLGKTKLKVFWSKGSMYMEDVK